MIFGFILNDLIVANIYPAHEIFKYFMTPEMMMAEEKTVRYQQYKHFMKNKENKYDFLELGVLEKFPYPKLTKEGKGPMSG